MNKLPYIDPSNEFSLHVGTILILLEMLAKTKRGKLVLNSEKLQIFVFLIQRPAILNQILKMADKSMLNLRKDEVFTVNAVAENVDTLFDRHKIKSILQFLSSRNFLKPEYHKADGFLFELSEEGKNVSVTLSEDYYSDVRRYAECLKQLQSASLGKLNEHLNQIIKQVA